MINLTHLVNHLVANGFDTVEGFYELPENDSPTSAPTMVYVDYNTMVSPFEEAITIDSAAEVGALVTLTVLVTLDAPKHAYPNVLIDLYKACQHYRPESPIKEQVRVFSFVTGDFLSSGGRRITKTLWALTFDRFIR